MAQIAVLVCSQNSSLRNIFCFAYLDRSFMRTNHECFSFSTVFGTENSFYVWHLVCFCFRDRQSRFCFKVQLVPDDILFRLTKIRLRSMQIQDSNSDFGELLTQLAHFENYNQRCIKSGLNYIPNLRRLPWLTTNRERCGYRLVSDSRDIFQSWSTKWVSN